MFVDFGYTDQELVMMILEELPPCFIIRTMTMG